MNKSSKVKDGALNLQQRSTQFWNIAVRSSVLSVEHLVLFLCRSCMYSKPSVSPSAVHQCGGSSLLSRTGPPLMLNGSSATEGHWVVTKGHVLIGAFKLKASFCPVPRSEREVQTGLVSIAQRPHRHPPSSLRRRTHSSKINEGRWRLNKGNFSTVHRVLFPCRICHLSECSACRGKKRRKKRSRNRFMSH